MGTQRKRSGLRSEGFGARAGFDVQGSAFLATSVPRARPLRAAAPALPRIVQVVEDGWVAARYHEGAAFPEGRETRIVFGPAVVCMIVCIRLCVFLVLFWNPKKVIIPIAEEFGGKVCPVWAGVGSWVPAEAGEGLLAP